MQIVKRKLMLLSGAITALCLWDHTLDLDHVFCATSGTSELGGICAPVKRL